MDSCIGFGHSINIIMQESSYCIFYEILFFDVFTKFYLFF